MTEKKLPHDCDTASKEGRGEIYLFLATVWNDLSIGRIRATIVSAMITPLMGLRKKMVQSF
jgi:hypothetical protein